LHYIKMAADRQIYPATLEFWIIAFMHYM
jgi:hypothetical protein